MNWNRIKAIIHKDIKEVMANKMVVLPMIIVPLILCAVLPGIMLIIAIKSDIAMINGAQYLEKVIPLYPVPGKMDTLTRQILYIFLNFTFIPFFMLIPIMVSSIIASNAIVGEKERKTLETLLYTPVTNREFIAAKLLSSFIPAVGVSFLGFIAYFLVTNGISWFTLGLFFVQAPIWIPAMLLLSPSVSLLGLSITLIVSLKAKSFMEAQQIAGVVVLPFIVLILVQMTGLVIFNSLYLILFALLLFGIDYLLMIKITPRFNREKIISTF